MLIKEANYSMNINLYIIEFNNHKINSEVLNKESLYYKTIRFKKARLMKIS